MKTTTTVTVDSNIKDRALRIIQNKMKTSLSALVNDMLINIVNGTFKKWN